MLNAIIMASGFSSRMGRNKLLLTYKGKRLIEHTLDKILDSGFQNIVLVAQDLEVIELGRARGVNVVLNQNALKGQSESIRLGIVNSPEAEGYAFFTGDQPLMDNDTIKFLMKHFYEGEKLIIVPVFNGKRGTPVIFPGKFKGELLALEGDTGGREVIRRHTDAVKFVEIKGETQLFDIDTEEDYRKLLFMDDK